MDTINKHLADKRERHVGDDENPVTAEEIELNVPDEEEDKVRNMLRKHEKFGRDNLAT